MSKTTNILVRINRVLEFSGQIYFTNYERTILFYFEFFKKKTHLSSRRRILMVFENIIIICMKITCIWPMRS